MSRDARVEIRLAAPGLLYAPFYLAKRASALSENREFASFKDVDFTYSRKLPSSQDDLDGLIEGVVQEYDAPVDQSQCLLAVGDPMRIISGVARDRDQPLVIGSLINKMCFWLLDTRIPRAGEGLHTLYSHFIVHPQGMTGYSVLSYHLHKIAELTTDRISEFLIQKPPGTEQFWYHSWRWWLTNQKRRSQRRQGNLPDRYVGYLTSDPLAGIRAEAGKNPSTDRKILAFYDERHDLSEFKSVCMTALITGRSLWENSARKQRIQDIVGSLVCAMRIIKDDPELAGYYLNGYVDPHLDLHSYPLEDVTACLQKLARANAFNLSDDLALERDQIAQSLKIRKVASIPADGEHIQRLEEKLDTYFEFPRKQVPSSSNGNLITDSWKALGKDFMESEHKQQHRHRVSTVAGFVVILVMISFVISYSGHGETGWPVVLILLVGLLPTLTSAAKDIRELVSLVFEKAASGVEAMPTRVGFLSGLVSATIPGLTLYGILITLCSAVYCIEPAPMLDAPGTPTNAQAAVHVAGSGAPKEAVFVAKVAAVLLDVLLLWFWWRYQKLTGGFLRAKELRLAWWDFGLTRASALVWKFERYLEAYAPWLFHLIGRDARGRKGSVEGSG